MGYIKAKEQTVFQHAFIRDQQCCVYCDRNMMESLDSFASIALDHLIPRKHGGKDEDYKNRVISCAVCNGLKGAFNPIKQNESLTEENFKDVLQTAKNYVRLKRTDKKMTSYVRDYEGWKNKLR